MNGWTGGCLNGWLYSCSLARWVDQGAARSSLVPDIHRLSHQEKESMKDQETVFQTL